MTRKRKPSGLKRDTQKRDTGKVILIVCEGASTEPNYFGNLVSRLDLKSVRIVGKECDSSPKCVVNKAIDLATDKQDLIEKYGEGIEYDEIWCVVDRDQHTTLAAAIDKAKGNNLNVALSVPCFEFWYLLHFRLTTKGFEDCDKVIIDLKSHIPDYEKSICPFDDLFPNTTTAIKNSTHVRKHGGGDPCTDVDKLVKFLEGMKR